MQDLAVRSVRHHLTVVVFHQQFQCWQKVRLDRFFKRVLGIGRCAEQVRGHLEVDLVEPVDIKALDDKMAVVVLLLQEQDLLPP